VTSTPVRPSDTKHCLDPLGFDLFLEYFQGTIIDLQCVIYDFKSQWCERGGIPPPPFFMVCILFKLNKE
jgi:hypothetical protein